ncbi:hypothetical protein AGLY_015262, partial [Aphis glycines]
IQFSVKNAFIQKYTLFLTAVCLVMTFMNMMNRIHYIGASYAIGAILMGITNHIHNSLSITGIGCILDMFYLISRSYNSSWASVRYFQCIIYILAIVYELMYMTMLHCYWQYTEATKTQPQTSWLKKQMILPVKLGQSSVGALNPSVSMPQSIQTTEPDAAINSTVLIQESNTESQNSSAETPEPNEVTETRQALTELNVTTPESNVVSEHGADIKLSVDIEPSTAADLSVEVLKHTVSSTEPNEEELNSIVATPEPIEITEPVENSTDRSNTLANLNTPMQGSNSAELNSVSDTQKSIGEMESKPISESDKKDTEENVLSMEPDINASEHNVTLTNTSATAQENSVSIPETNEEKQ